MIGIERTSRRQQTGRGTVFAPSALGSRKRVLGLQPRQRSRHKKLKAKTVLNNKFKSNRPLALMLLAVLAMIFINQECIGGQSPIQCQRCFFAFLVGKPENYRFSTIRIYKFPIVTQGFNHAKTKNCFGGYSHLITGGLCGYARYR
jgi:hypothetical protein